MPGFEPNPDGLHELLHGNEGVAFREQVARQYAEEIRRVAPAGAGSVKFRDTIRVATEGDEVAVVTDDSVWHLIEFGSVNNPPYRPFTSAAENIGLDYQDSGPP